jgi:hypothetical protein
MKVAEKETAKLLAALDKAGELPDYGQKVVILDAVSKTKWDGMRYFEISVIRKTDRGGEE